MSPSAPSVAMRRLTFLLIASILAAGCGLALGTERVVRGREIDLAAFESKLRAGMSAGEIEEAFGPPFEREEVRGGEEWRYLEVRTLRVCRPFVLFIPLGPAPKRRMEVRLEMGPSGLESAWLDMDRSEDGTPIRRSLLAGASLSDQ